MQKITMTTISYPDCTLGRLAIDGFQCFTLELPWRNNIANISCVPEGTYTFFKRNSPTNGRVLELKNVKDRTFIQIHAGNFTSHTEGCILVGNDIKFLDDDSIPDVVNSKHTLDVLLGLAGKVGEITIKRFGEYHATN